MKFLNSRYKKTIQNTGIFLLLLAEISIGPASVPLLHFLSEDSLAPYCHKIMWTFLV